jgi:hypothetical protein
VSFEPLSSTPVGPYSLLAVAGALHGRAGIAIAKASSSSAAMSPEQHGLDEAAAVVRGRQVRVQVLVHHPSVGSGP